MSTDNSMLPEPKSSRIWLWVGVAAIFVVTAIMLRVQGRLWICDCGTVRIWAGNTCSSDNSQHLFDPYAFTHVLHGFLFFWLISWLLPRLKSSWQLLLAVAVEAAWEIFENTQFIIDRYREETAALGYNGDTVVNSFGDLICCILGFLIARRLGLLRSLIVFVVIELILLVWIRDSLLLQILVLIYPTETIKAWQLCG